VHVRTRVLALLVGLFLLVSAVPAGAVADMTRLAGVNRYDTSAAINCCQIDGTSRNFGSVVLVSGLSFADALAGSFLAGLDNGILVLTDGDTISEGILDLMESAEPGTVKSFYVVGGTSAVSQDAVDALSNALSESDNSAPITRVAGESDIDTAVAVAKLRSQQIGSLGGAGRWAIIATVGTFADSLAAAPLAYSSSLPILYTRPDDLPPQTKQLLDDLNVSNVLVVGGTAAVSNDVLSEISELNIEVQRLAGPSRQETSVAVAEFATTNDSAFGGERFALARGDHFADALSGASHAGFIGAPILLTQSSTELGFAAAGYLERQSGTFENGFVYGGTSAISDEVMDAARVATSGANS
jgi:putative cell wall-binding protein